MTPRLPSSRLLVRSVAPLALSAGLLLTATPAHADDDIGTTPARSREPQAAPTPSSVPVADESPRTGAESAEPESHSGRGFFHTSDEHVRRRRREAPLATEPPKDWAVLYGGLRPQLGTFGGIAVLGAAQSRVERFYGAFSFATVRNDAGDHVGLAQLALGRNLSNDFGGGFQLSLTENRARDFVGTGQVTLAYSRAGDMLAVTQLGGYNRAKRFAGVAQLGLYDRTDETFSGVAQVGVFDHARETFRGLAQVGVVTAAGRDLLPSDRGEKEHGFRGIVQGGAYAVTDGSFSGLAQVGVGAVTNGTFTGLVQVGGLAAWSHEFRGVAQVGFAAFSDKSVGLQLGAWTLADQEHIGLQVAPGYARAGKIKGAQIGIVNHAREVRGVQIGLFNTTNNLEGVQIGLVNHAEDGLLPWTSIINVGFGDEDYGDVEDSDRAARRTTRSML
jgi:hypothetical protein